MLITFRCPAYSDITMFGNVALDLIEAMGHSRSVPGALIAEEVPQALQQLREVVQEEGARPMPAETGRQPPEERAVDLASRALPLLALLEAAVQSETYVSWDR